MTALRRFLNRTITLRYADILWVWCGWTLGFIAYEMWRTW